MIKEVIFTSFDILNFVLIAFLWWLTIKNYKTLPKKIPVHFDVEGKADNFGNKAFTFFTPVLALMFYVLFIFISKHPETANFPVEITETNKDAQFFIMDFFLRWLLMLIVLIFLNGQDYTFRYSSDEKAKPKVPMATAFFSVIGSLIAVFIFTSIFK